jgi:exodeoxyribonuclease VII small subunit
MKESFETAYKKLEEIINQIQSWEVPLEELVDKIKEANKLINYCEWILKDITEQVKDILPKDVQNNSKDEDLPF